MGSSECKRDGLLITALDGAAVLFRFRRFSLLQIDVMGSGNELAEE